MWRYRWLFPELNLFGSKAEAKKHLEKASEKCGWSYFLSHMIPGLVVWLFLARPIVRALAVCFGWLHIPLPHEEYLRIGIILLAIAAVPLGTYWFWRRRIRMVLRQMLQKKGIPICITCGYDLHGLPEPRCPECGREFDPAAQVHGSFRKS